MPVGGLDGILCFVLFLLFVMLIAFATMVFGGLLISGVSLPVLYVLPAVRRQFVSLTEKIWDDRVDSLADWRFVAVYVIAIHVYGFTAFFTTARLARALPDRTGPVLGPVDPVLMGAAVGIIAGGILLGISRTVTRSRLRAGGEWVVFLGLISVLVVVAFVAVPMLVSWLLGLALQ